MVSCQDTASSRGHGHNPRPWTQSVAMDSIRGHGLNPCWSRRHHGHTRWSFCLLSDLTTKTTSYSCQSYHHISSVHIQYYIYTRLQNKIIYTRVTNNINKKLVWNSTWSTRVTGSTAATSGPVITVTLVICHRRCYISDLYKFQFYVNL